MTSELLELRMAFRGLSDEDDGISNPGEDDDDEMEDEDGEDAVGFGEEAEEEGGAKIAEESFEV
jgi:hypothetical protein